MNKKIGIFYIATSVYKDYFNEFLKTANNIFPEYDKELIVISDGLNEYDNKTIGKYNIHVENIIDFPYPIINLCKFQIIDNYTKKYNIDYILYFDADSIIFEKDDSFWNHMLTLLDSDRLIASYHPHYLYHNEEIFYNSGFLYNNADLGAYIEPKNIHDNKCYIMSSFFMGSNKIIEYIKNEIYRRSALDLRNFRWIPFFSDETYLNAINVDDNILNNKNTIILDRYITINPYYFNNKYFNNEDMYHNNFPEINTLFINQKFNIGIKDNKRKNIDG